LKLLMTSSVATEWTDDGTEATDRNSDRLGQSDHIEVRLTLHLFVATVNSVIAALCCPAFPRVYSATALLAIRFS